MVTILSRELLRRPDSPRVVIWLESVRGVRPGLGGMAISGSVGTPLSARSELFDARLAENSRMIACSLESHVEWCLDCITVISGVGLSA